LEDLLKLGESIRRWKWLVIAVGVIGMLAALAVALGKDSSFTSRATLLLGGVGEATRGPEQDAVLARGYVDDINSPSYQRRLFDTANLPDELDITARGVAGSPFIEVAATAPTAAAAVSGAQAAAVQVVASTRESFQAILDSQREPLLTELGEVSRELSIVRGQLSARDTLSAEQVAELEGRQEQLSARRQGLSEELSAITSNAGNPNLLGMFTPAAAASEDSPQVLTNGILGLLGGLVLGCAIALVLGALQLRVTSPSVVRSRLGLPTLASISGVDQRQRQEDLQGLASGLGLMVSGLRSVAVTSPGVGEGKTLVASSLARYRAALGDRVILIDTNFRSGSTNGRADRAGLADLLTAGDDADVESLLIDSSVPNLMILPAGGADGEPYALITDDRMSRVLERAAPFADLLVIDTPAVLTAAESQVVCSVADRTILVLDSLATQTAAALEARDVLQRVHARLLGVVLMRVAKRGVGRPAAGRGAAGDRQASSSS
jgi:polysaccharide biosynthesis transport protein